MRNQSVFSRNVKVISERKLSINGIKQYIALALCLFLTNLGNAEIPFYTPPTPGSSTFNTAGTQSFTVPAGVTSITVSTWGGGGRGSTRTTAGIGGGGGGGAFSRQTLSVTPGQVITLNIGAGSSTTAKGGDSWASTTTLVANAFVKAIGGNSAANNSATGALGGVISTGIGALKYAGGNGATGSGTNAGGGGSSAGTGVNGNNGSGATGGIAPSGGGAGGNGRTGSHGVGLVGTAPGAGGGGSYWTSSGTTAGGNGAVGRVIIDYVRNETCGNGADDDGDGLTDCADPDCSTSVTLSTPIVSGCINQPLQDIATVSVIVTWSSAPAGGKLKIAHDNKIEWIDVAGGVTSPQTIVFNVVANGSSGNTITASWDLGTGCTVATSTTFTKPAACSSDQISCNILYLCGLDKPYDGEAFDKGFMGYVMSQNGGTTAAALTKPDGTGFGLYDIMSQSTQLSINLDNYSMIIISPTTEGDMATDLINALKGWKGSILNMNYTIMPSLGYSPNNYVSWSNDGYINAVETLLNYDNPTSYQGKLLTMGDYYATAVANVWRDAGSKTANLGGVNFKYAPHTNTQISSTHGTRVYLGYHMNGLYGNPQNLGALPVPVSSYFAPNKHLTTMGKFVLDNALISAATCLPEVCSNGTDDDSDGLVDCLDPDCNDVTNGEFDNGTSNWNLFVQGGAVATMFVDATNQLSGSNSMGVITTTTNGTEWHVQLAQGGESLVAGKTYKVSFKAKASAARNASVSLGLGISPYTSYFYQSFALTTTSQNYSFEFTASTSISNNVNLLFNLAAVNGTVWIDQVEFKEICPPPTLSCGALCPSQNKLINGSFDTNVSGWTSPTGILELGNSNTSTIMILNNADAAGPFTVYQDYSIGANQQFFFTGLTARHATTANAKVYLEYYNGTTYLSKTPDFNVSKIFDGTFESITPVLAFTPANTTKIRVVGWCAGTAIKFDDLSITICESCPEICTNGIDDDGDGLIDCLDPDCAGAINVVSNIGIINPNNAIGGANGTYAEIYELSDRLTLDLGRIINQGNTYRLVWRRKNTYTDNNASTAVLEESSDNISWTTHPVNPSTTAKTTFETTNILANVNTRYLRVSILTDSGNDIELDAVLHPCGEICTNGIDDDGDGLIDCADTDCIPLVANAGVDQTQCMNGAFTLIANNPSAGQTGLWSIVSGTPLLTAPLNNDSISVSLQSGQTATLRWTISKGGCTRTDDVIITNTTGCSTVCVDAINRNGDIETEGTATNFNLTFQGTPALLMNNGVSPEGWGPLYGSSVTNTTTFQGAYYIKKTGAEGNPHSGTHMIYAGGDFCFTPYYTNINISCGKTYKISLWAAAYTNGPTQLSSPFDLEFATGSSSLPMPYKPSISLTAPASTSWNVLNWQRYEMTVTIPSGTAFEYANFYITTSNATRGLVVDDVCITEVSSGSDARAGADQYGCSNVFTLAANTPPAGYTGAWTVLSGTASLSSTTAPNATATITAGTSATLAWTVSSGVSCSDVDNVVIGFANNTLSVNNQSICAGSSATLTATGCTGSLLWSNGATTGNISVSPASTTTYNVTCTPTSSANLSLNGGFESATNMQDWVSWGGTYGITTVPSEIRTGSKAAKIDGTTLWGGFAQSIAAVPGELYTIKFWAKSNNTNAEPLMQFRFLNSASVGLVNWSNIPITSTTYQEYIITTVSPLNTSFLEYAFSVGTISILFIDDVTVTKVNGCVRNASGTVTVNALPTIVSTTPGSICAPSGTVVLGATASAGTINWYAASTGGASLGTGTSFTTPSISANTTYFVDATNSGCITSSRTALLASVNTGPTVLTTAPASRCGAGTVILGATASAGTLNWYAASAGGSSLGTGVSYTTPSISTTTTYYVETVNGTCTSARISVVATINTIPSILTTTPGSICASSGTVVLGATASAGTINWYAASTGGVSLGTGTSFTTPSISANTTYFVDATNAGCITLSRTAVLASVNTGPTVLTTAPASRCGTGTVILGASASAGTLNWYAASTGGASLDTGTSFTTPSISATTTYYVDATNAGCTSARTAVIASVNTTPTVATTTPGSRCGTGTVVLGATASAGTLSWYAASTGGASLGTGATFTTPSISATTTYYVDATNAGCTSARSAVTATVNDIPTITATMPASRCGSGTVVLGATASAGTINWYSAASGGASLGSGTSFTTPSISTSTTYFVESTDLGCTTSSRTTVTATINAIPTITATTPGSICGASGTVVLGATTSAGTITWYAASTGGVSLGTGTSFTTPSISANTTYYIDATNAGCTTASRTSVLASVNTGPAILSITPGSRCGTGVVNLSATASAATINWYAASTGGSSLFTGGSFTTPSISGNTTYYVETSNGGCTSSRTAVLATINPIPGTKIISSASRCGPGSVTLSVLFGSGNSFWYDAPTGGNLVAGPTNSFTTPSLNSTTTYYIEGELNGCISASRQAITATINPILTASINFNGSVCLTPTSQLSGVPAGGTGPFTYSWTGPSGFSSDVQTISINTNGNYNLTITDSKGCSAATTGFVYTAFEPLIVSLQTTVCQGESVNLNVSAANVTSYLWGANAGNATTSNVTVTPSIPSTAYNVTVTNNVGCAGVATATINVTPRPTTSISGPTPICVGQTSQMTSNSTGTWVSNNPSVATINASGLVTGVGVGSSTFTMTNTPSTCNSLASAPIAVNAKPNAGPDLTPLQCNTTDVATMQGTGTGTWTMGTNSTGTAVINNTTSATTTVATFSAPGNYYLVWTNVSGCKDTALVVVSDACSCPIANNDIYQPSNAIVCGSFGPVVIDGASATPQPGVYLWEYSINNGAYNPAPGTNTDRTYTTSVLGVGEHKFRRRFTKTNGTICSTSSNAITITVNANPTINSLPSSAICVGEVMSLTAVQAGTWISNNPGIASISSGGLVTGLFTGNATFTFTQSGTGCSSTTGAVTVKSKPTINSFANTALCLGEQLQLTASTTGTWSSSNNPVATISSTGLITAVGIGQFDITFTAANGCSTNTINLDVLTKPGTSYSGLPEVCVGSNKQLLPSTGGIWTGFDLTKATITSSGIITGLSAGQARFVYKLGGTSCPSDTVYITINPSPSLSINFNGSQCFNAGMQITALGSSGTPSYSYNWTGPSSFTSTSATIIVPVNGNYAVTVIDSKGCTANTTGFVYQEYAPFVVNLNTDVCEGTSVNLSVNASGTPTYLWSANASNATSQSVSIIPSFPSSTYQVTVTNNIGCTAVATSIISVKAKPIITINGAPNICIGGSIQLTSSATGTWANSNPSVASISSTGLVTGLSNGSATFIFTASNSCISDPTTPINVNGSIPISNLGSNALCIGGTTQLSPSTGGTWTSSNPNIATVNNSGLVTAVANGFVSFSFVNSGSGCSSNGSLNVFINAKPSTLITGDASICPSSTTTLWPSTGGTWVSNNPSVATINNSGLVTGVSQGSATFVFTETSTGCPSDNTSPVTVKARPVITLSGPNPICAGSTTTFITSDPGQWVSSNSAIAIINNSGVVTGMQQGTATFLFTSNVSQCASLPSAGITVNGRPTVSITGPSSICIGSNTQMSPTTGGTWVSTNPSVATINNSGLVLGVSTGTVRFIFTNSSTGCISNQSGEVLIYSRPTISVSGPTQICIGGTTNMLPASGGSWASSNSTLANISNTGLVTALGLGTVTFTYTESGASCVSNASVPITIVNKPIVSISGSNPICIGANTQLSPSLGGNWISNNPSIATVSASGLVTSLSSGLVTFTFTTTNGCVSDATSPLIVNGKPIASINGPTAICVGSTTQLSPSIGGTWTSGSNFIATVSNTGLVMGVSQGVVRFSYVDNITGCKSDSTTLVTVLSTFDPVINGANNICIGSNTQLSPTVGGIWLSSNPTIANISNSGLVTGLSAGSATFIFANAITGCLSNASAPIIVNAKPTVGVTGSTILCIGQTSQVIPATGGTWVSLNPTIASVNNQGEVIALSQGVARFQFTNTSGCAATTALPIIINGSSQVSLNGPDEICIGGTSQLLPNSGGTWSSNNISIASIDNNGLVTGLSTGKATFKYIESLTGCETQLQDTIVVKSPLNISVAGLSSICIGLTTQLLPSSGGIWTSNNASIASVNNSGVVKGLAGGKVTFSFIEAVTGCISYLPADAIQVVNCIDPDVNIHFVSSPVNGSVATNDDSNLPFSYNNYLLIGKPLSATTSFTLQSDGSYTFNGDRAGKYIYKINVCQGALSSDCPSTYLTIDLVERNTQNNIAANTDFLTIYPTNMTTNYVINVAANDGCINSGNCTLDVTSMVITDQPNHGSAFVNFDGTIRYQHTSNFIGFDTIVYRICENGNPLSCDEASVILMIGQNSAPNSTVAVDDFYSRKKGESITGDLLINDSDPEGNSISIIAQGSLTNPIVTSFGSYFISTLGEFNFTPNSQFSGASQIIYTLCDNHPQPKCTKATIYLLYQDDLKLKIRGYLQGALVKNSNQYSSSGKPLMRDNLRLSPQTGLNYIPGRDPYTHASKFINIGSIYTKVGPGLLPSNQVIADSTAVFAVSGENAIVDWVFIELRDQSDNTKIIATRSGLIQRDGDIVDLDGISDLKFNGVSEDSLYIVFKHRSHLAAMTNKIGVKGLHDFSNSTTPIHSYGTTYAAGIDFTNVIQANISSLNVKALWSGDMNCDGRLKFSNPFDDQNSLFFDVVTHPGNDQGSANYNFAFGYIQGDIDMDSKAKYDNPDDDKNLLFSQMFSNPLNVGFLANFNYFIQQVPVGTPK